jgi:hypothetical protein
MIAPPYPDDLAAKGWCLDLDYERIEQSDTWAIATPEQRPWLLMIWLMAWRQIPIGSLPPEDHLIAARIGLPLERFKEWKSVLLTGFDLAANGRLYHSVLVEYALKMVDKRVKEKARVAAYRSRIGTPEYVSVTRDNTVTTSDVRVSTTPPPPPEPEPKEQEQSSLRSDSSTAPPLDLTPVEDSKAVKLAKRLAQVTQDAMTAFNAKHGQPNGPMPSVSMTVGLETKRKNVARCLKVAGDICQDKTGERTVTPKFWEGYFAAVDKDEFKSGRNTGSSWMPSFEYLTRPQTMLAVFEATVQDAPE